MQKHHVRKGDKVLVISGKDKGRKGKILLSFRTKNRVVVEGANLVKRHTRASQKSPKGGIVEKPGSINISNVQLICPNCDQATRIGSKKTAEGKRIRICRKCESEIDKG